MALMQMNLFCIIHSALPSMGGVQVYALGIKLLDGPAEVQHFPIEDILPSMEWRPQVAIAAACIVDPYVLLHFSDGSAVLLSGSEDEGERAEWPTCPALASCGCFLRMTVRGHCNTLRCAAASLSNSSVGACAWQ